MLNPVRALLALCAGRWLALAVAAVGVSVIAAVVEGRPPDAARIRALVGGPALCLAAAWGLQAWRAAAADLALSALGHRPALAVLTVAGLTALATVWAAPSAVAEERPVAFEATQVRFHLPDGVASLTWHLDGARRRDEAPWRALPPPSPAQAPAEPPGRNPTPALAAAAAIVVGLGPRLGAFAATGLAAALWAAGALAQALGWT